MSNPLSHVGQTARPEMTQAQLNGDGQRQSQGRPQERGAATPEPPATRLPQHPLQQQRDPAADRDGQERIRQQGETRAEDTALPAPTDAD